MSWPVALTDPADGSAIDLTGATAAASLNRSGMSRSLDHSALGPSGAFVVSGPGSATGDLPLGRVNELWLAVTDAQGGVTRYVWPVVGEVP